MTWDVAGTVLYGWIAITNAIMVVAWAGVAFSFVRNRPDHWLWSKVQLVSIGMVLHSVAMTGVGSLRAYDMVTHPERASSSSPWFLMGLMLIFWASAMFFVRARSIVESQRREQWPWATAWFGCALWLGLVLLLRS